MGDEAVRSMWTFVDFRPTTDRWVAITRPSSLPRFGWVAYNDETYGGGKENNSEKLHKRQTNGGTADQRWLITPMAELLGCDCRSSGSPEGWPHGAVFGLLQLPGRPRSCRNKGAGSAHASTRQCSFNRRPVPPQKSKGSALQLLLYIFNYYYYYPPHSFASAHVNTTTSTTIITATICHNASTRWMNALRDVGDERGRSDLWGWAVMWFMMMIDI